MKEFTSKSHSVTNSDLIITDSIKAKSDMFNSFLGCIFSVSLIVISRIASGNCLGNLRHLGSVVCIVAGVGR